MARESTDPVWLVVRGALAGLGAFATVVGLVYLTTVRTADGLQEIALLVFDAHAVPGIAVIPGFEPLTWFGLPPVTLYALPLVTLAFAGLVAARFTRSTSARDGVVAGLPVALGYAPLAAVAAAVLGVAPVVVGGLALAYALVFGVLGGFVGART